MFTSYHTSERDFDCFHFAEMLFENRIDKILYVLLPGVPMGPQGAPGVIWRSPQPSKNEPKTHQKMTPSSPLALPEHENCLSHRMQKLYQNQTFRNRIFSDSRNANGAPKVDLEAPKWAENSTKTHRADSAPTSELRKDSPGARSRHSGRVGRW